MGLNMIDEIDSGNFFDQIDDLIEFPPDSECGNFIGSSESKVLPSMWSDPFFEPEPFFQGDLPSDLLTEISVPYEDTAQLEWLSTFVEDSYSCGGLTIGKDGPPCVENDGGPNHKHFQTLSPISVLESTTSSTSSCSVEKTEPPLSSNPHRGPQKARSKRPRPVTFTTRPTIQLVELGLGPTQPKQKQKKIRPANGDEGPIRKCMHCEITKTPQWRSGPMGPKTLCNACGVRHKSGRLFPEYRPAASPTFMPALHSNSHKKVLEMRGKGGPEPTKKPSIVQSP
ncbi:GATA transcription factor 9 [Striga hermonthica]|uniref:GATA transcription factor 9 n=1 Tax=Striga hermonthica TaxID=68872 RepID=A0A9N7N8I7_STRHE|nr:GATA transcription factor 9 [Striga hermonthica]